MSPVPQPRHPEKGTLEAYLRTLDTGAMGLFLHVLRCDECATEALASLAPPEQRLGLLALRREVLEIDYCRLWERLEE